MDKHTERGEPRSMAPWRPEGTIYVCLSPRAPKFCGLRILNSDQIEGKNMFLSVTKWRRVKLRLASCAYVGIYIKSPPGHIMGEAQGRASRRSGALSLPSAAAELGARRPRRRQLLISIFITRSFLVVIIFILTLLCSVACTYLASS